MRSKYELAVARRLDEIGVAYEYESYRLQYWRKVAGARCKDCEGGQVERSGWYTPDFWLPDIGIFLETKGRFLSRDRSKMQAVLEQHPEETIVLVFMSDNKIHPHSTTRYSAWCSKIEAPYLIAPVSRSGQVCSLTERELRQAQKMYK